MDKWSKKKASETCGGLGMSKFIDANEAKRLNRLKSIKSTKSSFCSHNGWQQQQIEKRRKEQLRQRKKGRKKKPLGDGIEVDTKINKSDAISKCGLKLKVQPAIDIDGTSKKTKGNTKESEPKEEHQETTPNPRVHHRKYAPVKPSVPGSMTTKKRNLAQSPKQGARKCGPHQQFQGDEGKENSDNGTNEEPAPIAKQPKRVPVPKRTLANNNSNGNYYMDIDSLKREHADAIRMLEELDKCEGYRRKSLDSDNSIKSPHGDSGASDAGTSRPENQGNENAMINDEFGRGNASNQGSVSVNVDKNVDLNEEKNRGEEAHAITESFLDMTHLSVPSIPDEFEGVGQDNSFVFDSTDRCKEVPLTPAMVGSAALSCESVEESDFFGDADTNTCSSDDEDGYSSGTFR